MSILVYRDQTAANAAAATLCAAQMIEKPDSVIAFAPGQMLDGLYARLVGMTGSGMIDWSDIVAFTAYEYIGVPKTNKRSMLSYLKYSLFDKVNLQPGNIYSLDGCAPDLERMAMQYEDNILNCGGIDLMILCLGHNGHLAFNEPGRDFSPVTHTSVLTQSSLAEKQSNLSGLGELSSRVITMGIGTIMAARKIVLLAYGSALSSSVYEIINHPITPTLPASVLQLHNNVIYILDENAAVKL